MKYYCSKFTQSAKARYYSAEREDKEHVCDYLNRLNGYARNAGVQFENGGREAKDHVDHFLDTCDDRGLEERLCHARVKDIHDLDEMINDILRSRERKTAREPSVRRHRGQDDDRRRENRSSEGTRSGFGRDRRFRDDGRRRERRDESPYRSRITLSYDADEYSDAESDPSEVSADAHGHVDATNDNERRAAAAGTFARPDNRRQSGGSNQFQCDREGQLDKSYDADEYSDAESDASEVSADAHGHVDATNDNERRAATAGTFARPDNRRQSGGSNQFQREGQLDKSYDADEYSDAESDASEVSADAHGHVDATNDSERRAAAAGTFARPDNRRQSGGSNQFQREGQLDKSYDADEYSDAESDASEVSADAHGHVDATNDSERRAAAAGTFARPDNRRQSGGSNQFQCDREGRRQYGPCARGDIGSIMFQASTSSRRSQIAKSTT
ncbi:hypothetical protein PF004_g27337 [Phytophthora fragariae]|uniref:Retrotransposon gag domain-containing protein n=1 Tax=Phytophthora fragariae TaxID=53985 RepID=A0A6G0MKU6_9STRA|nr:hypothetical protein PF004_g27337 [Phytophthora fragariae]